MALSKAQGSVLKKDNDTIIHTDIYTSVYSKKYKYPIMVFGFLYKGGGDCNREDEGFTFKEHSFTHKNIDFVGTGGDKGHAFNAEDFAFDCNLEKKTFDMINVWWQTHALNAGPWKVDETYVRQLSHKDSLLIIEGGYSPILLKNDFYIPDTCWKIVQNVRTKKIIFSRVYPNLMDKNKIKVKDVSIKFIQSKILFKLPLLK